MHHYDDKDFKDKHIWIKKTTGLGTYKSMIIADDKFEIFEHSTYMIIRLNNGITLKISSVAMTNLLHQRFVCRCDIINNTDRNQSCSQWCGCQQHDILSKPHGWPLSFERIS
jgi:hypothetical protein